MKKFVTSKYKVIIIILGLLLLTIGIGFWLFGRNNNVCTVYFETNGGKSIEAVETKCGKNIDKPKDPEKAGFDFKYWIYDGNTVDFDDFIIDEDVVLYAYWEANDNVEIVYVHFDTAGGNQIDDIEILKDTILNKPLNPTKDGYKFKCWMLNDKKFDFSNKITEDITLVAKWEKVASESSNSGGSNTSNDDDFFTTSDRVGYFNSVNYNGDPILRYESGRSDRCSGSFRSDVPAQEVEIGYNSFVNSTWSTGGDWSSNANECFITYRSSNNNIATVSDSGKINAKEVGTVYIYECLNDTHSNKELLCFKGKLNIKEAKDVVHHEISSISCRAKSIMEVGETQIVASTIEPTNYSPTTLTWSSSDTSVVDIIDNNLGQVKALKPGEVRIKLKAKNGIEGSCSIKVIEQKVPVNSISINKKEITLEKGKTEQLKVTILPTNATDKNVTWAISDPLVATVNSNGLVTAVGKGSAIIKVTSSDGTYSDSCKVTVNYNEVEQVSLNKSTLTLDVGDTAELVATITPTNAANKNISWSSSNESVVTVNANGLITAKKEGKATITVTTEENGYKASCVVTVKRINVTGISLNKSEITLNVGDSETLIAQITPSNAANKNISWSSSDESVATVNANGIVVAKAKGSATISVTSEDGNYKATTKVIVNEIKVTGIQINLPTMTMKKGEEIKFSPTITPSNATNKNVIWSSSNESIVTVSESGLIKAIKKGSATITVTSEDGNYSDTVTIIVVNDPLLGTANISNYFHSDSSGQVTGISVTVIPKGGSGSYTYDISLYRNGSLIASSKDVSRWSYDVPGYDEGVYYAEITIKDSDGDTYSFVTDQKTIV